MREVAGNDKLHGREAGGRSPQARPQLAGHRPRQQEDQWQEATEWDNEDQEDAPFPDNEAMSWDISSTVNTSGSWPQDDEQPNLDPFSIFFVKYPIFLAAYFLFSKLVIYDCFVRY